jgi:hypothetical protein
MIYILIITIVMKIRPAWIYAAPGRHRRSDSCPGARGYKSTASLFVLEAVELGNVLGTAATRWRCSLAAPFSSLRQSLWHVTARYDIALILLFSGTRGHGMAIILLFSPDTATISDSYQYVCFRSTTYMYWQPRT